MPDLTTPIARRVPPPLSLIRWGDTGLFSAWMYAERLHRGQLRPRTDQPYIHHPFAVCKLLRRFQAPRAIQQAALLHDVVEDQGASLVEIAERFSPEVANLVMECSRVTTAADGPRHVRHQTELQRMRSMSPAAQSVKLADIACNSISIARRDPTFARTYLPEKMDELAVLCFPSIPSLAKLSRRVVLHAVRQLSMRTNPTPLRGREAIDLSASLDLMSMRARPAYTQHQSPRAYALSPS